MKYAFFPYARRGAAASIAGKMDAKKKWRPQGEIKYTAVSTEVGGASWEGVETPVSYTILGPGDVTCIVPTQIISMSPRPNTFNMEPNYLAHVEFAHPDLPWLFTPEPPDGDRDQLQPWICLVVVEERDGQQRILSSPGSPNPLLQAQADELPDLETAWAWAHVQVADSGTAKDVLEQWESNPGLVLSRLIAPRHLEPNRRYVACVVPTYASGVLAGKGELLPSDLGLEPAWTSSSGSVRLPAYYHWRFGTGPAGDFETLAQKLRAVNLDEDEANASIGCRRVHLDALLSRLQAPSTGASVFTETLNVRTAIARSGGAGPLSPLAPDEARWKNVRREVQQRLKRIADFTENARKTGARVVGPPIYGQWHAEKRSLDDNIWSEDDATTHDVKLSATTPWLTELNADVETRSVAAVGTRMVQHDQEDLMALAWEQLEAVAAANRRARWAQLAQTASVKLHARRLGNRRLGTLLRVTSPLLGRLRFDEERTVANRIDATALPVSVIGAAFSRATRFAARSVARGSVSLSTTASSSGILNALVQPMLAGKFTAYTTSRFGIGVERISPKELRGLLEKAGVATQIEEATGLTLKEHVNRLDQLPELIRSANQFLQMDRQVRNVGPARPTRREEPTIFVQVKPGSSQFDRVREISEHLVTPAFGGELRMSPRVLRHLQGVAEQSAEEPVLIPLEFIGAINEHLDAGERIDIHEGNIRLAVSAVQRKDFQRIMRATPASASAIRSMERTAVLHSAVLAQFNIDKSIVPHAIAGLDDASVKDIQEAAKGIDARLTRPEHRAKLPSLSPLKAELARNTILGKIEPTARYNSMLAWANPIPDSFDPDRKPRRRTPSHPIMAAPRFDEPMVKRLKRIDKEWVLGHADALPPNSISIMVANTRFVESFLVGANHEMARELQWRNYPTDLMGTCFARFWPSAPGTDDIEMIARWGNTSLGENAPESDLHSGEEVMLVVRGELLLRYPDTVVSAVFGKVKKNGDDLEFVHDASVQAGQELFRGFIEPDITYCALAIDRATLKKKPANEETDSRWYIALTQPPDEPRFGLDDDVDQKRGTAGSAVEKVSDLSWQNLPTELFRSNILRLDTDIPDQDKWKMERDETAVKWGKDSHAGQIASILLQLPFQLLLRASDFVPDEH